MSYFSDLHLELLARGVLERGETLLGKAVTTYGPRWALGFLKRTCVLLATSRRLILLEHRRGWIRRSLELASVTAIPWQDVEQVKLKGLLSVEGARRVADAFQNSLALPPVPRVAPADAEPASRPPTLRLVRSEPVDPERTTVFRRRPPSLEGTWRLLAVEGRSEGRTISTPFGLRPIGRLVYMSDGRMSVMIMAAARAKFGSHGLRAGTGPEKAAAFDSFLAYSGRYERLEDRVIHHPDVASIPDFVGVPEERFVSLDGDRLILSTPPMLEDGRIRTFVVVWQRVSLHASPRRLAGRNDQAGEPRDATTTMKMSRGR
jgi:hypothetical protein